MKTTNLLKVLILLTTMLLMSVPNVQAAQYLTRVQVLGYYWEGQTDHNARMYIYPCGDPHSSATRYIDYFIDASIAGYHWLLAAPEANFVTSCNGFSVEVVEIGTGMMLSHGEWTTYYGPLGTSWEVSYKMVGAYLPEASSHWFRAQSLQSGGGPIYN